MARTVPRTCDNQESWLSSSLHRRRGSSNGNAATDTKTRSAHLPTDQHQRQASESSSDQTNLASLDLSTAESHTDTRLTSYSWRSETTKERDNFERISHRVRHLAPRLFSVSPKSNDENCDIFPRNFEEWKIHRLEALQMAKEEEKVNLQLYITQLEARKNMPEYQKQITSAFGPDAEALRDGRSLVLAQPTIWCIAHNHDGVKLKGQDWPAWVDLPSNDEVKAQGYHSRRLPRPRATSDMSIPFRERPLVTAHPLDRTGLMLHLHEVDMREVTAANLTLNRDESFDRQCRKSLSSFGESFGREEPVERVYRTQS